jgi:mannose-1-phosphate guanylyltransferase
MNATSQSSQNRNRWAVILAGGDGVRLRSLTRRISGDDRPKQFCPVLGDETLLDQTRRRVKLGFSPERIAVVVTKSHEPYYSPLLSSYPTYSVVVQPDNRGTSPAILYSLLRIFAEDPNSVVAFFPSDHYVSDDYVFMKQVSVAMDEVCVNPDMVVLLGITPDAPEVEYGWIEPGYPIRHGRSGTFRRVYRFWEKPAFTIAEALLGRGCLWNSFVMAGTTAGFVQLIRKAAPQLYSAFQAVRAVPGTPQYKASLENLYRRLPSLNFSEQVLVPRGRDLSLLPIRGISWSDLGTPQRVIHSRWKTFIGGPAEESPPRSSVNEFF